jgi:23S rRNA pseudouridine1911/1915/1917 synthase
MRDAPPPHAAGRHRFTIDDDTAERLDLRVARLLDVSRTQAATLIATGGVTVDAKREKASFRAPAGAVVEIEVPRPEARDLLPEDLPLEVVFEDESLLVIDKAAGMVVHPAPGHWSGTLVNALLGRGGNLSRGSDPTRAGLVHRLDKGTSGLIVVAKTEQAHRRLAADLAARRIRRRYAALCRGHLNADTQTVDAPVARDRRDRRRMAVDAHGRSARTDFVRIARFATCDLLRAHLHTGRTHQIRVHLASIGHPVLGDETYGGAGARKAGGLAPERHFLHAAWLRFRHPETRAECDFRSELPVDLRQALASAAADARLIEHPQPLGYLGFFDGDD